MPVPDALTQFFWDGVADGRLLILRCTACGFFVHWPRPICPRCSCEELRPEQVSGRGVLDTFTIPLQPYHPYFAARVPYVLGVVELAEQRHLKLVTNVVDCPPEEVTVGMPLQVVFRQVAPGLTLPLFAPAS